MPANSEQPQVEAKVAGNGDCNCRSDIEAKLLEMYRKAKPEATGHEVQLQGYGFLMDGNTLRMRPFMEYKGGADHPGRQGFKRKPLRGNLTFSFCPFCGAKYSQVAVETTEGGAGHG